MRSIFPHMRIRRVLLLASFAGAALAGCADLDVTNPNQQSSQSFWATASDAERGLTAVYNQMSRNGVFGRWHVFAHDIRSDIGTAEASPWGDLGQFNAFRLNDYNFEINRQLWFHNYEMIGRANLVIANVPAIEMDDARKAQIIGEAKFLRALGYWNLVTLYENIPLPLTPQSPEARPATADPAETWAAIEADLVDASNVLLDPDDAAFQPGRPSKWTALGMLGKVRLQQRKWDEAIIPLGEVIAGGDYVLLSDYQANFRQETDMNAESLFEVATEDAFPIGILGISFPKMVGPCYRPGGGLPDFNPTWCDARPTRWYFERFMESRTTTDEVDPRADVTLLYKRDDRATEQVFGRDRGSYFVNPPSVPAGQGADTMIFFRKYGEWHLNRDQVWDNPINYKVLRYADILLMQAEALNENDQTPQAYQYINQVRARVGKSALAGLTKEQLRDTILFERMFEFGLEASRFNDLMRHNRLSTALESHDNDFGNFIAGTSERLPIPTTETNLNPNAEQNFGW